MPQLAHAITHPNILEFERRRAAERQVILAGARKDDLGARVHQGDGEAGRVAEKLAEKAGVGARTVSKVPGVNYPRRRRIVVGTPITGRAPAQIPACAIQALGSKLGCLTANRRSGHE